jgi:COMPASS component SPP1
MKAFTDSITNKKTMKQLSTSFVSYPKPAAATIHHHSVASPAAASNSTQELINTIQAQLVSTRAALDVVLKRQQILQAATDRADSLPPIVVQAEETRSSKSKRKAGGGPTEDKQCAWDARLIWDDQDVLAWDGNEREDREICGLPKRKCDRHQGWPKTATISLELEHAQLVSRSVHHCVGGELTVKAKQEKALVKQETEVTKASAAQEESDRAKYVSARRCRICTADPQDRFSSTTRR